MHLAVLIFATITIAIPPAAKVLAIVGAVYGILQGLKKVPAFTAFLTGWKAIAFNVALTILGLLVVLPADQLYTVNTLNAILTTIITALAAAGIHGTTVALRSKPQMLATIPPDPQVKEVPATLVPDDPNAVPLEKP